MQDRLSAKVPDDAFESGRVRKSAQRRRNPGQRRVMDARELRASPFASVWRRSCAKASICFLPSLPVAIKGAVGTAELEPMIAISPQTRRYG